MAGFHQLRVRQKIFFKRHAIKAYQQWVIDAKTIAFGSAPATIEGGTITETCESTSKYSVHWYSIELKI